MVEIKAREGYYLSDPNKEHFYSAISGVNVSADDYIEVPIEEAEEIMLAQAKKRMEAEVDAVLQANTGCPNCRLPGQI